MPRNVEAVNRDIPDLLVAAIAELAGLVVLHLDKDFELIATGRVSQWSGWP